MVNGVLNDSTNQPKRTKVRSQSQPPSKERPAITRTLFAPEQNNTTMLPMPNALTASLPTFDGKSEKFELFEDLFRNNIKMYPHLTEIQKINYFHSLLRGDALQAFCNIEDSKKHSLDEIITIFKRRFGDYLSMAKARCAWDALKLDPSTQKRIPGCTTENCKRSLWNRGTAIHRQGYIRQNARPRQENTKPRIPRRQTL